MNSRDHEELLSAYHDGELAGEERASVEWLVGDDHPAREALEEIADLSRLLGAMPRPAAPSALHAAVMQQIRQAAPIRPTGPQSASRSYRYWIWSAATVACLLLVVFMVQHNLNSPSATGVALNEERAAPDAVAESLPPPATAMAPADVRPMPMGRDIPPDALPPPMAAPSVAAAHEMSADLKALEAAVAGGQRPQIGDVLKSIVHDGDQVLIVQYTVLDVAEAFGEAQVLLEQNGIETITGDQQAAQRASGPSEKFYAILVDAPDDKVGSTLAALQGAEFVHDVAITNIDALSRFPLASPKAVKPAAENVPLPKADKPAADDVPPLEPAPASQVGERGTPSPPPAPTPANAAAAPPADEGVAVPIPVPFSEKDMQDLLAADGTESVRRDPGPPSRAQAERPPGEGGAGRPTADRAASAPRKRILIVLVPERPQP